ncbi:MBL fold metallo-hydrolase [Arthrobacter sp. MYb211]|uniref:MBL fold metallo-hydrolase n=1 Tax=unclassified Arthrobacter TaxID=235627 RepID=UPI000CFDA536|nr:MULTISPECIES: MBL fold metallo-hydrolase [unclassified Arthrobacter]PRA08293.1 MBL fold metallo-hydrolase [Arthrobacter sp. MYb221]PRC02976.1 MBL fold metallo-hydrolase [Arthrobacter sp. MYb211]
MEHLAFPTVLSPGIAVLRADNPSEMTLEGTNTYLLFDPQTTQLSHDTEIVVVDPGPDMPAHLRALAAFDVQMILLTHRHGDHSGGIPLLHELTGAPVRARLAEFCRNAEPLVDGERLEFCATTLRVLFTPGHTSDSVCFVREGQQGALFTGDTVLGRGTTILEHPDGTLADYLDSLARLSALADMPLHPAHGEQHAGSHKLLTAYREHRESRLEQVRVALAKLGKAGADAEPAELLDLVYPDLDPRLAGAASSSLEAQLHYLAVNS